MNERKKPLVVCVEDDKTCCLFLERVLKQGGYDVCSSETGAGGLKLARELRPDLILLDVVLPDMDGFQVCARLQEDPELSNIPVIFQTSTEVERAKVLSCGGVGCLLKPLSADDICDKVRQFSAKRSTWEKLRRAEGGRSPTLERPDFARFKETLVRDLHPPPDRVAQLDRVAAASVYTLAKLLGLSTSELAKRIAEFLKFGYVSGINPEHVQLGVLPASYCRMNLVVAVDDGKASSFVLSNPFDWLLLTSLLDLKTQKDERKLLVTEPETIMALFGSQKAVGLTDAGESGPSISDILAQLSKRYQAEPTALAQDSAEDLEPIILLVNKLIEAGQAMGASDIHIEPWEECVVVRYRVDGDLRIVNRLYPQSLIRPIVSRIKVMASLDISERRLPQDGRIVFKDFSRLDVDFDLRVATAPMNFGEKVVMRIVDKEKSILTLPELGFSPRHLALYREVIDTPYGMILHVGPTGSGKSMTLYAALAEMQSPEVNIQTAEDPIEYTLAGINQMQMRADVGLTFQRALRCYLRQDPDIILIGEIRDRETAEIAVEASLTGHLLLSTLHTNDAPATITRFIQIGVEPFMVSSSIVLICAQRLLRRLCPQCKEAYEPNAHERELAGMTAAEGPLYRHKGCAKCSGIGYMRRIGVHEILVPDDAMRTAINQKGITAEALKRMAVASCGMTTLYWDAMEKVRQGTTSLEEVISKVRQDEFDARPKWMLDVASA